MDEPKIERIDPNQLWLGPLRHESLAQDVLDRIATVYGVIGPYLELNLEQFEIRFMRDVYPEAEVAAWCCITAAWQAYHQQFTEGKPLTDVEEENLVAALVLVSTGAGDSAELPVNPETGARLVACFLDAARLELD